MHVPNITPTRKRPQRKTWPVRERKNTHTIDITLVPPEEPTGHQVRGGEVENILVNANATIRVSIHGVP
jgi:hypothetical protein